MIGEYYHKSISTGLSLCVVIFLIAGGVVLSLATKGVASTM